MIEEDPSKSNHPLNSHCMLYMLTCLDGETPLMPVTVNLARRLREARESAGLRQEDVARHLGLSRPSVAQIELGNRTVTGMELAQLARRYGRDMRDFLAEEFDPSQTVLALFRTASREIGEEAMEAF